MTDCVTQLTLLGKGGGGNSPFGTPLATPLTRGFRSYTCTEEARGKEPGFYWGALCTYARALLITREHSKSIIASAGGERGGVRGRAILYGQCAR